MLSWQYESAVMVLCLPDGRFLAEGVGLEVLVEMVAPHELPVTLSTLKLLLPGVGALVARQLVGPGKPTQAELPVTHKRLFSWIDKTKIVFWYMLSICELQTSLIDN